MGTKCVVILAVGLHGPFNRFSLNSNFSKTSEHASLDLECLQWHHAWRGTVDDIKLLKDI